MSSEDVSPLLEGLQSFSQDVYLSERTSKHPPPCRRRLMHRNTCAALPEYMRAGFLLGKRGHVQYLGLTLLLCASCTEKVL